MTCEVHDSFEGDFAAGQRHLDCRFDVEFRFDDHISSHDATGPSRRATPGMAARRQAFLWPTDNALLLGHGRLHVCHVRCQLARRERRLQ